ncbi:MAG: hypothetical protein TR69_WS6001001338 [candidate division WS6 bacterium OLB20]|uniref:Uncharacterized protein n=1 Tax=candidate division WS6 bacterium OLB20 TaxID=1617426 RepID=A0A136LWL9_9BACT|nr:MAG: hypothetical protein TR69_WS6001001338 [candidate division WS6 bacterium OLB20]
MRRLEEEDEQIPEPMEMGGTRYGDVGLDTLVGGSGGGGGGADSDSGVCPGAGGGAGGGAVQINANTIVVDGQITVNGGNGGNYSIASGNESGAGGGGSGGSIHLDASSISGSGSLSALGGTGGTSNSFGTHGGNGAQGRIRISFSGSNSFAGTASPDPAVYLTANKTNFTVENGQTIYFDTNRLNTYTFTNLTVESGGVVSGTGEYPLTFNVTGTMTVAGEINVDGMTTPGATNYRVTSQPAYGRLAGSDGGYAFNTTDTVGVDGEGDGGGQGGQRCVSNGGDVYSGGGGGGYATAGEKGQMNYQSCTTAGYGASGGGTYGDAELTVLIGGSGGGGGGTDGPPPDGGLGLGQNGGAGGGALRINANVIDITGTVSARGGNGTDLIPVSDEESGAGGGGSGGAIWINAETLENNGSIIATGGTGGVSSVDGTHGGDGGDGRIKITTSSLTGSGTVLPAPGATGDFEPFGATVIMNQTCTGSTQARFQIGLTGLHKNGSFAVSTVDSGAPFQWSAVMNGDVNQIFGGEVTLKLPDNSTVTLTSANGENVPEPFQTGVYSIEARALNGALCDKAEITVLPDPGSGEMLCGDFTVTTVDDDTNVCENTVTGIEEVYVRDESNGYIVGKLTVDLDTGRDWGVMNVFSRDKSDFGAGNASLLHYPGGAVNIPGIVGSSYSLYIPRDDDDVMVHICPGAERTGRISQVCSNGIPLTVGITGQYEVSLVTLEGKDYFEVAGVTGTGGITIPNGVSDTLTRLQVSEASDHLIKYATVNGINSSGDTTEVRFDTGWDLSAISISDIDIEDDGTDKTLAAAPGVDTWGVTIDTVTDTITFTAPTSGTDYIDSGSMIVVKIGTNADGGVSQIVNPVAVDSYELQIKNENSSGTETAEVEIPIIDDDTVNITGYIDTFITFDIDTAATDEDCDAQGGADPCESHGGANDDAGYTVDLGELSPAYVSSSGDSALHADGLTGDINSILFDLSTNANGGAVVQVRSQFGYLNGSPGGSIPSVSSGSEVQITAGSGLYGLVSHSGMINSALTGGVFIHDDCDGDNGSDYFCSVSTTSTELYNTAGGPIDQLRLEFGIGVSPDNLDGTGTYTDQLTFIASATF